MYAILGATGQVGGAVLETLLKREPAQSIRVVGRRKPQHLPPEVEWRQADLRDSAQLADALSGAAAAFVLSPVAPDVDDVYADGEAIAQSLAAAVTNAGQPRIVALSSQGAQVKQGTGAIQTLHALEAALSKTGARTTFVRPAFFIQSWLPFVQAALATGQWYAMHTPVDQSLEAISARDVGIHAAGLLTDTDAPAIVNVRGSGAWSEQAVAQLVGQRSGKQIEVVPVPPEQRVQALRESGLSESYAQALAQMYTAIEAGAVPFEPAPLELKGTESMESVITRALQQEKG